MSEAKYLTVTALARRLGVSPDTIYRMERNGQLPARVIIGRRRVWWTPAIAEWEERAHAVKA